MQPATGRAIIVMGGRDRTVEALGWLQGLLETKKEEAVTGEISDYVGDHPLLPSFILRVTEDGGQLYVQGTRQPRIGLRAAGADKFTQEGVTAALTFERDASGEVAGLVLQQNGAARPAKRFPLGSQSPEKKSLRRRQGIWKPWSAIYALAAEFKITISRRGGASCSSKPRDRRSNLFSPQRIRCSSTKWWQRRFILSVMRITW